VSFSTSALAKLKPGAARAAVTAVDSSKLFKELFIVILLKIKVKTRLQTFFWRE
jgi:hypothetical protein